MRTVIDVPLCLVTRIWTPMCGTFTPTVGSAGSQYSLRSSKVGTAAWPRMYDAAPVSCACSVNESDFSSPNGAS